MSDTRLELIREQLGCPGATFVDPPVPLSGGFSNEILGFRLTGVPEHLRGPLVIRLGHPDADMTRECIIQQNAAAAGVPAPPVLAWGTSDAGLGRPFAISPLMAGATFDALVSPRNALGAIRRLPAQLATTMRTVHEVDCDDLSELEGRDVLDEFAPFVSDLGDARLQAALRWLEGHMPAKAAPVICHGDLHPFNLLFDDRQVVAILDWELARLADPAYDVARTALLLRAAPYPMNSLARRGVQPVANRLANRFVHEYRSRRSLDDRSLRWHDALHCVRTLAMATYGAAHPENVRLARLSEVWLPVAPLLRQRLATLGATVVQ